MALLLTCLYFPSIYRFVPESQLECQQTCMFTRHGCALRAHGMGFLRLAPNLKGEKMLITYAPAGDRNRAARSIQNQACKE